MLGVCRLVARSPLVDLQPRRPRASRVYEVSLNLHLPHSRPLELVLVCDIVSDIIVKGQTVRMSGR